MKLYHVNAFTDHPAGGNPAGVVILQDPLTESQMLAIAKNVGYSETAFISESNYADFQIRFFTPVDEVDLCGHATIASFSVLLKEGLITSGHYTQETKAGILSIDVTDEGQIFMEQLKPSYYEYIPSDMIAQSLRIPTDSIISESQVVSTGLKDIMVHVKDIETMVSIRPDFNMISDISKKYEATGYHVFTLETKDDHQAHCRNFAPLFGIDEEAATGTASGALCGYLFKHQLLNFSEGINYLSFEQGYEMNQPSHIFAQISQDKNEISKVIIGGKGIITKIEEL